MGGAKNPVDVVLFCPAAAPVRAARFLHGLQLLAAFLNEYAGQFIHFLIPHRCS